MDFFSKEISLGNLVTIAVFVFTLYRFHISNVQRIAKFESKMNIMWSWFKKQIGMVEYDEDEK